MFINFDAETFPHLYKSIVWPTLEYGNLIWGPFYLLDQQRIERVQRKATRLIKEISHLHYEERLLFLKLQSLYYRRYHGDMIITFNLINHHLNLDSSLFAPHHIYMSTRGHQFKLYKSSCFREVRHHVFSHRVINQWNSLPQETANVTNTNTFKQHFDSYGSNILYVNSNNL